MLSLVVTRSVAWTWSPVPANSVDHLEVFRFNFCGGRSLRGVSLPWNAGFSRKDSGSCQATSGPVRQRHWLVGDNSTKPMLQFLHKVFLRLISVSQCNVTAGIERMTYLNPQANALIMLAFRQSKFATGKQHSVLFHDGSSHAQLAERSTFQTFAV